MKKAYLTAVRKIEIRDVPPPRIERAGDVLILIDTVGVCGSDLHYYRQGRIGVQVVEFPFAVGHECAGTVLEVGRAVKNLKRGRRVAIDPLVACGRCDQCKAGRENTCRDQKFLGCPGQMEGAMAELLVMPARSVLPIPRGVSFDQAVMSEPLSIALWARKLAGAVKGRKVAILGCGPIGLCVLQAVKAAGPCTVYATDLLDARLSAARKIGADWTGSAAAGDVVAAIGKKAPLGVDLVFECAGVQETIDHAARILTPGGTLMLLGIPAESSLSLDMNYFRRKEIAVQNVRRQNRCHRAAIGLIARGEVNVDPQVTHHFSFEQSQRAFDLVADYRDGVIKAMIRIANCQSQIAN